MTIPDPLRSLVPTLAPEVRPLVRLGILRAEPVTVEPSGPALEAELAEQAAALGRRYAGRSPAEITPLADARDLYRAFGIDPTRTRPSSEALLRRVLKGKPLPRILNAVDLSNLCSLRFLLPIGLYDLGKINPPIILRRGRPDESYPGIRKEKVHVSGRPVLVDQEGPFGNPSSDSLRASVTRETDSLLMVIFAPASRPADLMEDNVRAACEVMERHLAPTGKTLSAVGAVL